jgi:hypothetical protein
MRSIILALAAGVALGASSYLADFAGLMAQLGVAP